MAAGPALRWAAMTLVVGIAVVALLGVAVPVGVPQPDECVAVTCPEDSPAQAQPCLHDHGCGGGALGLAVALVAVLAAAPLVIPPRAPRWSSGPPPTTPLRAFLLPLGVEHPPRPAVA